MTSQKDINTREHFLSTLAWLLTVVDRYAEQFNFALVKIAYGQDNELGDAYGAQDASQHLSEVTQALSQVFRKSDLITRNGSDVWIIFPYTPFSENIYQKIREVIDSADHEALHIVNRKIAIFTSPFKNSDALPKHSALETLDYLKANQTAMADHTFVLLSKNAEVA